MNRAELVKAIAACEALAGELRRRLKDDAVREYVEHGTAPSWRMPGVTVSTAVTQPSVVVADERAWLEYVNVRHPTEVETVRRARPAWQVAFLTGVAQRGDPPCDADGLVIPGLVWQPGGDVRAVAVRPSAQLRAQLTDVAREIADGRRPLALPTVDGAP